MKNHLTPEEAFELANSGTWVNLAGYFRRNKDHYGQYQAFGEYPDCIRSCQKHDLQGFIETANRFPGINWRLADEFKD